MEKESRKTIVPFFDMLHVFPGAITIFPLLITATITTIGNAYGVDVWGTIGNPVKELFSKSGLIPTLGLMLFFIGTQVDVRKLGNLLKLGLPLFLIKHGVIFLAATVFLFAFSFDGLYGLGFVLFLGCMAVQNAGLYNGIADAYADDSDRAFISLSFFSYIPALFFLAWASAGNSNFNYLSVISTCIPLALGLLLGNLDFKMANMFSKGNSLIAMFIGFQLGGFIDFRSIVGLIPLGLILTAFYYLFAVLPGFLAEKFIFKRSGYLILSFSGEGVLCLSLPSMFYPEGSALVESATGVLTFVMVVTSLLAPLLTDLANRYEYEKHPELMGQKTPRAFQFYREKLKAKKA